MQERHQWVPPPSLCLNLNILVIFSFLKIEESFQGWNWIPPFTITCTPPITRPPQFWTWDNGTDLYLLKKKQKKTIFFFLVPSDIEVSCAAQTHSCLTASVCLNRPGRWWTTESFRFILENWAEDRAGKWTQEPRPSSSHARSTN